VTATEHKAAFRTAVQERIEGLMELKKDFLEALHATKLERDILAHSFTVDVLWEVVDRLVDDLHETQQKQEPTPNQEAVLKAAALKEACVWNGHYKEDSTGTKLLCLCKGCVKLAKFLLDWREREEGIHAITL
jgi:hypothetical protein